MKTMTAMMALGLLAACHQRTEQNASIDNAAPLTPVMKPNAVESTEAMPARGQAPTAEPQGAIDPKSTNAARQVVEHYGALIEQDRWDDAARYWGDADAAAAFKEQLHSRGFKHLEVGKPSEPDGAAGSIYVTIPASFYGVSHRRAANVILRRVNDVPGSTEAQRRWHIERIEWAP